MQATSMDGCLEEEQVIDQRSNPESNAGEPAQPRRLLAKSNPLQRVMGSLQTVSHQLSVPSRGELMRANEIDTPKPPPVTVDYRDRISIATWLLVFGMGLRLLFTLPSPLDIDFNALGSPITVSITDSVLAAALLGILAAACTESILSVHPWVLEHRQRSDLRGGAAKDLWPFWSLPVALTAVTAHLLSLAPNREIQVAGLLIYAIIIATTFFSLYATVEVGQVGFRRGRATLNTLTYGCALLLFLIVYQTRTRSLLSGTLVSMTAALLAVELLRSATHTTMVIVYGAIVGAILGQVTWALNYWPIVELTGGLLLALIFYLLVGIAQQGLQGRLNRRTLLEYAFFAWVALLMIALVGRGFQDILQQPKEATSTIV